MDVRREAVNTLTTHKHKKDENCPFCEAFYGDLLDKLSEAGIKLVKE